MQDLDATLRGWAEQIEANDALLAMLAPTDGGGRLRRTELDDDELFSPVHRCVGTGDRRNWAQQTALVSAA